MIYFTPDESTHMILVELAQRYVFAVHDTKFIPDPIIRNPSHICLFAHDN